MRLSEIQIRNFKSLLDITVPLSKFVCIIGENNAGKSSVMLALLRFIEGGKLDPSYFFDTNRDVVISVKIQGITESDLSLIPNPEHRSRFSAILNDGNVTLVRRFPPEATSRLRWMAREPIESRFKQEEIDKILDGQRPGPKFVAELEQTYPELKGKIDSKTNQSKARDLIREISAEIPDEQKESRETDLPSGIDNSIRPFLPDPIYIPGVKDLADEIKTKDSASFGRLLGILLNAIAPELSQAEEAFGFLRKSLNRTVDDAGQIRDDRLDAVRQIEATVEGYVRQNFPKVRLDVRIPPPEIKTILSSAEVWADDGVFGPVGTKGDGLKRAVTFAILRAYVELKNSQGSSRASTGSYVFLFEEPELFLHPLAQRALFDALGEISSSNHVIVTTHSPLFFQPSATSTFIKMLKSIDEEGKPPCAKALAIDVSDLDTKAQFQLITFETTNTAFFSKSVVLVEGDSDYLVFPHLAKLLKSEWNSERVGLAFCRISGKGSIERYRKFFNAFNISVSVIADLDCLLDGFEHLDASEPCKIVRERLIQQIDTYLTEHPEVQGKLNSRDLRDLRLSNLRRIQYEEIRRIYGKCLAGTATEAELAAAGDAFFEDESIKRRRSILQRTDIPDIVTTKRELLRLLRLEGICLLEKGEIESYYPPEAVGPDKPSAALKFCEVVNTREKALALSDLVPIPMGAPRNEFELIFEAIFDSGEKASPSNVRVVQMGN